MVFGYNFCMEFFRRNLKYILPAAVGVLLLVLAFVFINPFGDSFTIFVDGMEQPFAIKSRSTIPADFLKEAGFSLRDEDRILVNGLPVAASQPIENPGQKTIQYFRSWRINLNLDGQAIEFYSSAPTLGRALWEHNIFLVAADAVSIPLETPITRDLTVSIRRSQPVRILLAGGEINLPVAAENVGQALAQAGISLQNLDYSQPAENEPIPADRTIKVVRVSEEVKMQPTAIPYTTENVADAQLELDEKKLVQAGEYGLKIARIRIRYEDGKEVSRKTEAEFISKAPVVQKYAYGTRAAIGTLSTPNGVIEYYRAVSVWITSYHDTGSPTASGKWPAYGDVAVRPEWYRALKGSRLYIPGYGIGTITDVCPGCVGKYWIDVFIPTADYVGWHKTETVYFLTPIPANPLWVLP
jgi:resuscitation-promoting factor RpfB